MVKNMQTTRPVTKPTKQRKMLFQAPDHIRHKMFAAHLSPELRGSHGVKTLPVRSGDSVRIMRGDHEGFEGKVTRVSKKDYRVYVEGLTREKVDGTTVSVPVHPSKIMITRLNLDDKWRKKILERKKAAGKKIEEAPKKTEKEKVVEEKVAEKKPRRRRVTKKPIEEKTEETEKEEKPKAKKPRAKRKTAKKTKEGE